MWNKSNGVYFKTTYPDKLFEIVRVFKIVNEEQFPADHKNDKLSADKVSKEVERLQFKLGENDKVIKKDQLRVEYSSAMMLMGCKETWDLLQDISVHEKYANMVQSSIFNLKIKSIYNEYKYSPYFFIMRLIDHVEKEEYVIPEEKEIERCAAYIALAILECRRVIKKLQENNIEDPVDVAMPYLYTLLMTNMYDEQLTNRIGTNMMTTDSTNYCKLITKGKSIKQYCQMEEDEYYN